MIDLHAHSCFSDGTDTPAELVRHAELAGLKAVALTDHDTVDGLPSFLAAGAESQVETVPGIEISADAPLPSGGHMHLLGYYIDPTAESLKQLTHFQEVRRQRAAQIVERLNALGIAISIEALYEEAGEAVIGRPHIATLLMRHGTVDSVQEAFDRFLSPGKPAFVDKEKLTAAAAIQMVHDAGGLAILAHPLYLGYDNPADVVALSDQLTEQGLDGLELFYPTMPRLLQSTLLAFARSRGLLVTGGSDYHGSVKPDTRLGTGPDGLLNVPDELLLRLKEARDARVST